MLIILGIIILICGLKFKVLKIPERHIKKKWIRTLPSSKIIEFLLKPLTRNKAAWTNKIAFKIIELSETGLNLTQFYLIKISCLILTLFLVVILSCSNASYEARNIIASVDSQSYDASKYKLFKQVLAEVGEEKLSYGNYTENYMLVEEKMPAVIDSSNEQLIKESTTWFLDKWQKVQRIKVFKYYHPFILVFSLFLPELILIIRWLIRGSVFKKEIIKLEYIFELLARIDGVKTLDIVYELEKSSKIYSKYFKEFAKVFMYDKKKGFACLYNKNIKSLTKLTEVLEIYSLSDREVALQILEREVMERDEAVVITADETVDFIDVVAFLSIVPLVYELVMLMLNPMLDVVYKAFEFM